MHARFPLWSYAKLIFTCWLVIPQFSGAAYVYEHYVRPYIVTRQKSVNLWYVPRQKNVFSKPGNILTAAENYIHENESHGSEKMMHRVCQFCSCKLFLKVSPPPNSFDITHIHIVFHLRSAQSRETTPRTKNHTSHSEIYEDDYRY